jgi:hypothetical protein
MADPEDIWPLPDYNPGGHYHLHALGVISIAFASFERSIDSLYNYQGQNQNIPLELCHLYYFSLNEEKRIEAIRLMFGTYEKSDAVKTAVNNILGYFQWCRHVRNQILHAEQYPPSFGGDPDTLHLTKRVGKQSSKSGYMAFSLPRLRDIAEKIRAGTIQCIRIYIYLRVRDRPASELSKAMLAYKHEPLPQILRIPRPLKLSLTPKTVHKQNRQQQAAP